MKARRVLSVPGRALVRALSKGDKSSKAMIALTSKLESATSLLASQVTEIVRSNAVDSGSKNLPENSQANTDLDDGLYSASYFGAGRNPESREGLSGYESYDRESSNANLQAYTTWRVFPTSSSLEIGCALGWSVEAFRELGYDTTGVEYSHYAVDHCAPGAQGHIFQGDIIAGLDFPDHTFELVTAFEILEHLPPESIDRALEELRRVCSGYVFATIPTFGPNKYGPDGWFYGKVRDEKLAFYDGQRDTYTGLVPFKDLMRDKLGNPVEGHLTIASFDWWQERFESAGFERSGNLERRLYPIIDTLGLTGFWNLHVYKVPGSVDPPENLRDPAEISELEARWAIDVRKKIVQDNF